MDTSEVRTVFLLHANLFLFPGMSVRTISATNSTYDVGHQLMKLNNTSHFQSRHMQQLANAVKETRR
jgi:cell division protein FtsL